MYVYVYFCVFIYEEQLRNGNKQTKKSKYVGSDISLIEEDNR